MHIHNLLSYDALCYIVRSWPESNLGLFLLTNGFWNGYVRVQGLGDGSISTKDTNWEVLGYLFMWNSGSGNV